MPASAGAATAVDTPGTISNGTPARASASASSPPRPNTNGSPHLSRTTFRPRRAYLMSSRFRHVLGQIDWRQARLPTKNQRASGA